MPTEMRLGDRRYFDRRRGITALGATADHYAGLRTIVIPGTQPDAPYVLDALLDPQTSVRPREIVTDTAGYTDIMFALYRLLGYLYSPRLADAGAATLWRLNATDYGPLNQLARHQINPRLIRENYDDVLRIAGSLLQRHTTASQLVRALRSQTRHLATLARALQHIGRAPKTIHLLDYCNDEQFRRRILVQLNRGEDVAGEGDDHRGAPEGHRPPDRPVPRRDCWPPVLAGLRNGQLRLSTPWRVAKSEDDGAALIISAGEDGSLARPQGGPSVAQQLHAR